MIKVLENVKDEEQLFSGYEQLDLVNKEIDEGAEVLDRRATRFKRYMKDLIESKNLVDDIRSFIKK